MSNIKEEILILGYLFFKYTMNRIRDISHQGIVSIKILCSSINQQLGKILVEIMFFFIWNCLVLIKAPFKIQHQ